MGGHGGLNILPQKKWNVYNFDNRERVRRDEEAAAREEQIRQQKARQLDLEFKLEKLREIAQSKRRRVDQGESGGALEHGEDALAIVPREASGSVEAARERREEAERPQHINLFAEFEAREREEGHGRAQERERGRKGEDRERRGKDGSRKDRKGVEKVDGKPTGEPVNENYELGHGVVDKNGKKPWYLTKTFMLDRTRDEEKRSSAKLQITGGVHDKTVKSTKKCLEQLRSERTKREQQEKDRVKKLVIAKSGEGSVGYNRLPNGRAPRYHASYGNAR